MRKLGFEVTEHVGRTGVVAVMKNGPGPVLLIRADMDALPVKEQTGLPFASHSSRGKLRRRHDTPVSCMPAATTPIWRAGSAPPGAWRR